MAPLPDTEKRIAEAQKLAKSEPAQAERIYQEILSTAPGNNDAAVKNYENALVGLGELYRDQKRVSALAELVRQTRSVLSSFAKAKTAKLGVYSSMGLLFLPSMLILFASYSTTTPRPFHHHPEYDRRPDLRNEIMHRMGNIRTARLPASES